MITLSPPLRVGALGLLAVAAIGCGGSSATPSPSPEPTPETAAIVVEASEFKYQPPELTIPSAGSTTIELVNTGTVEHDLTIDALEFQVAVKVGEAARGTLTDVDPGTYEFYCTIPGHAAAGMVGSLVVE